MCEKILFCVGQIPNATDIPIKETEFLHKVNEKFLQTQ